MAASYSTFYSNRFEKLYEMLRDNLYSSQTKRFAKRRIVVPSGSVKDWLQRQFAFDSSVGIAMGLTFLTLDQAVGESVFPTPLELALKIESELPKILAQFPGSSMAAYLKRGGERQRQLATALARHFSDYLLYGVEMVARWEAGEEGWQPALWRAIFAGEASIRPLIRAPEEGWHLFGFCHLSPLHLHLFTTLGARIYLLAPTHHYWGDLATDREAVQMRRWGVSRGFTEKQLDEMTHYLADRNPLLANLGSLGRSLVAQLADAPESEERFVEPGRSSLLAAVQSDLLALEPPQGEPESLPAGDRSIEVYGLPSRFAEVERLRDRIISWLESTPGARPSQILVLAPKISDYWPYIEALFGQEEPFLPFQIGEGEPLRHSLSWLLELAFSRWEATSFLALLENDRFAARHRLSQEELDQIRSWLAEADIRWGADLDHRRSLLALLYGEEQRGAGSSLSTWSHGLGRLLDGMAMAQVEMSQAELLGRLIDLFETLRRDLAPFSSGESASLGEWADRLAALAEDHFDEEVGWSVELRRSGERFKEQLFPFASIRPWVEEQLKRGGRQRSIDDLAAIRFCSIAPMQLVPAELICLLGMDESATPRQSRTTPLDCLRNSSLPSPGDRDRYFFLESLLSARSRLLLTYRSVSQEEGLVQPPSLLIDELFAYLDRNYRIGEALPSDLNWSITTAPSHHPSLFQGGEEASRSQLQFARAKALYQSRLPVERPRSFELPTLQIPKEPLRLSLSDLRTAVHRPVRLYFREQLHLSLDQQGQELEEEESFALPYRDRERLVRRALTAGLETAVEEASRLGLLPTGGLDLLGRKWLSSKLEELSTGFETLQIDPKSGLSIELSPAIRQAEKVDGGWRSPPLALELDGCPIELFGRLDWTLPRGYPILGKRRVKEALKRWPDYLVHAAVAARGEIDLASDLLFVEEGEADRIIGEPIAHLRELVRYTLLCRQNLSPVRPDWAGELLAGKIDQLDRKWRDFEGRDPYLEWLWPSLQPADLAKLVEGWRQPLYLAFGQAAEAWGLKG